MSKFDIELPEFNSNDTEFFFKMCDLNFKINKINDQNVKFTLVLRQLPASQIELVRHLIMSNDHDNAYVEMQKIIMNFNNNKSKISIKEIFELEISNKFNASSFCRLLEINAKELELSEAFIKQLIMQKIPKNIALIILNDKLNNLSDICQKVDKLLEFSSCSSHNNTIDVKTAVDKSMLSNLTDNVNDISFRLKKIETNIQQTKPNLNPPILCYYHNRYGNNANKCIKPCSYSKHAITFSAVH